MAPKEREEQENWAKEQLKENSGACAAGFDWERSDDVWPGFNGYQCQGSNHFVTDQLIAEGKGRCYESNRWLGMGPKGIDGWDGPYDEAYFAAQVNMTVEEFRKHQKNLKANMSSLAGALAGMGISIPQVTAAMSQGGLQQGGRQPGSLRDTMAGHGFFPVGQGGPGGRPGFLPSRFPPGRRSQPGPRYDQYGRPY